jgi:hypothetical protein
MTIQPIVWTGTRSHAQGHIAGMLLFQVRHTGGDTPFRLSTKLPLPDEEKTIERWNCTDPADAKRKAEIMLARFVELVTVDPPFTREDVALLEANAVEWDDRSDIFADKSAALRTLAAKIVRVLPRVD